MATLAQKILTQKIARRLFTAWSSAVKHDKRREWEHEMKKGMLRELRLYALTEKSETKRKLEQFVGLVVFVRRKITLRALYTHAKIRSQNRKRNTEIAKKVILYLRKNVENQQLIQKKHSLILGFYSKKRRLKILPVYFELLRLHAVKNKKERGIE